MSSKIIAFSLAAVVASFAGYAENEGHGSGSMSDRPIGLHFFNNHLTIKPYVSLSYTYDSNVRSGHDSKDDTIFCVSPGANFDWKGDRWSLSGALWYSYNHYFENTDSLNQNSYGESLNYGWSNIGEDGKGWNLLISERYQHVSQSDGINSSTGHGVYRDRELFNINGVLERRFANRWHANISGQYSWLDYLRSSEYAPLYGWSQYAGALEFGYVASPYTDLLASLGYSGYNQKRSHGKNYNSNNSSSWSLLGGLGTHATEKITYRALVGVSQMSYGGHEDVDTGYTYQLSANWRATRQLQFSVLGNSYYQPSERSLGQAIKVSAISAGLSYLTLGDKMNVSANVAYRFEETVYNDKYLTYLNDYDQNIISARLGASYIINRWVSVYGDIEVQECLNSSRSRYSAYDYDRFRATIGMKLHY